MVAPGAFQQEPRPVTIADLHCSETPEGPTAEARRLVARLRARETRAFDELYAAFRVPIFNFLCRLTNDRYAAEDLFQNTWIKISRAAPRLHQDTRLRAWTFTIARNEFRSYRRWQMVDISRLFLFQAHHRDPGHEQDAADRELDALERAMRTIGPGDREVLLLVCVEGLSPQEAANVLGVSYAAVRQRLGRARARLRDALERLEARIDTMLLKSVR
jgi:RNA polymerase sigma-70 factor (ECF subfamily)